MSLETVNASRAVARRSTHHFEKAGAEIGRPVLSAGEKGEISCFELIRLHKIMSSYCNF